MQEIQASLSALKLGAQQVFRNLALYPLVSAACARAGYVLLEEALERRLARVTEVSESGRVPELAFENASAEKILLVDGDELVGAKQNRVLNLSVLVAGGARVVIPVSCVEQG
ncbi:MAG: ARPP-1 family domain-containing protein, partial [Burkholderiales bacterium]